MRVSPITAAIGRFKANRSRRATVRALGIRDEPGTPMAKTGLPARKTMAGPMVLRARLPGPMRFGAAGPVSPKLLIELFITTPVPGGITPAPK